MSMSPVTIKKTETPAATNGTASANTSAASTPIMTSASASPAINSTAAASTAGTTGPTSVRQMVRALYNYDATEESEISFKVCVLCC